MGRGGQTLFSFILEKYSKRIPMFGKYQNWGVRGLLWKGRKPKLLIIGADQLHIYNTKSSFCLLVQTNVNKVTKV